MQLLLIAAVSAKPTVWEKVQAVPMSTWWSLLAAAAVVFLLVRVWRSLQEINEFAPWIALVMVGGSVVLYWTYERTEPRIISPVINVLADYFPTRMPHRETPAPN